MRKRLLGGAFVGTFVVRCCRSPGDPRGAVCLVCDAGPDVAAGGHALRDRFSPVFAFVCLCLGLRIASMGVLTLATATYLAEPAVVTTLPHLVGSFKRKRARDETCKQSVRSIDLRQALNLMYLTISAVAMPQQEQETSRKGSCKHCVREGHV